MVLGRNLQPDAVSWLFTSVLKGLEMHGQHEGCNATLSQLALLIYDALRPRYTELRMIMNQIPDIQLQALDQFDQRILHPSSGATRPAEKKRRDQFKKLIAGAVGKEVHIRNLPSLFKMPKVVKEPLEIIEDNALLSLFAPDTDV
ncbi:hypothetical protein DNTS_007635 [Danionella cerebrum]|uniref:Exportin-5 C-terminal domain-containing protein n=1 Tax=Danionella cerebrum TaxID=2873325 RepID=A0A553P0T1_9TELE|nr:hypothetical protein DNTS_007635 [Danionella translucida]